VGVPRTGSCGTVPGEDFWGVAAQSLRSSGGTRVATLLHAFLAGRSLRLLPALEGRTAELRGLGRVGLERDAVAAREFFALGPRAVRGFRLRHALALGPVDADVMAELLEAELATTLGPFWRGVAASDSADLGRRTARQRQLRDRLRDEATGSGTDAAHRTHAG